MSATIIIPARFASTRLPGKPLLRETGKYLIEHVYEQAIRVRSATAVIVATDDERILEAVESFGGIATLTRPDHLSGTDRIAEVASSIDSEVIVNLQGDEPQFDPEAIEQLIQLFKINPATEVATIATPIPDHESYLSPNCVKVVLGKANSALYFSRSPIPHNRDGTVSFDAPSSEFLQHLGIYGFRRSALLEVSRLAPHPLENREKLEQLRWLANGYRIEVLVIEQSHKGIDTPEDYAKFVADWNAVSTI